jgi:hypothetical protein
MHAVWCHSAVACSVVALVTAPPPQPEFVR